MNLLNMYYVYILKSISHPEKIYVGYTGDIATRILLHNDGKSAYSSKYKPWELVGYIFFQDESKAIAFEKYLKSGSGRSFAKNHFL